MRPHDGLMILALLILGAIAGCDRRKDARTDASREAPPEQNAARVVDHSPPVAAEDRAEPDAVATASTLDGQADDDPGAPAAEPQPPAEDLYRARHELHSLAEGAVRLRSALLHADFRAEPNTPATEGAGHDGR